MKHLQSIAILLVISNIPLARAFEEIPEKGQVYAAEPVFGLFELAILTMSIVLFVYGLLNTNKSKK